ncbi:hypothetical protein QBC34DRAFT_466496 [Podospora aff. communis PSN243]|uniref:Fungal N-terminal domain-containing protein n=1 Tax=Podospora aff. communis PSN243 TaxID=3040156 RepID=A0AAV9GIN8_9PEZI|nr:hypothetical protein QBC34DRAFT_466496 [Podospora aff. communis PSN243]
MEAAFGILGAVASCTQLATMKIHVASNIASLKQQWSNGPQSLQLLIAKLSTIRVGLDQIKHWSDFSAPLGQHGEDMRNNLGIAMEGCRVVIEALDQDVIGMLSHSTRSRLRQVIFSSAIREHEQRLDSQITALQLLMGAAQCRSLTEQRAILEQATTRAVFRRIRDDTATIRERSTVVGSEVGDSGLAGACTASATSSNAFLGAASIVRAQRDPGGFFEWGHDMATSTRIR